MMGMNTATSGLHAAQSGLNVTGHNMANNQVKGFSRQRSIQQDMWYRGVGSNANGKMQIGTGVDIIGIRQIRNEFLDLNYRKEVGKLNYFNTKYSIGMDIQSAVGELQSAYATQTVITDLWSSLQDLTIDPSSIETRGNFISTCISFLDKMDNMYRRLTLDQNNLNEEVIKTVDNINQITEEIHNLNIVIREQEAYGQYANDYRDQRNLLLDELSKLINIEYKENSNGEVQVFTEGKELISNGTVNKLGLRYTSPNYSFVEPVFTNSKEILPFDKTFKNAKSLYNFCEKGRDNTEESGHLKSLLISRGFYPANFDSLNYKPNPDDYPNGENDENYKIALERNKFNATKSTIPKAMRELDILFNKIITLINDSFADGYNLNGENDPNFKVFELKNGKGLYSLGNVIINPKVSGSPEGYNLLQLSKNPDKGDAGVVKDILEKWKEKNTSIDGSPEMNIDGIYSYFINNLAEEVKRDKDKLGSQEILVNKTDSARMEISGVSLDEEMSNMMIYQHAYNAAARMINTIDSMIDTLVNRTGRVGL